MKRIVFVVTILLLVMALSSAQASLLWEENFNSQADVISHGGSFKGSPEFVSTPTGTGMAATYANRTQLDYYYQPTAIPPTNGGSVSVVFKPTSLWDYDNNYFLYSMGLHYDFAIWKSWGSDALLFYCNGHDIYCELDWSQYVDKWTTVSAIWGSAAQDKGMELWLNGQMIASWTPGYEWHGPTGQILASVGYWGDWNYTDGVIDSVKIYDSRVTGEVVPEPSSLLALGSLVTPLVLLRRRKEMKTLLLVVFLLAIAVSAFALPTYTSNTHTYNAGGYGMTNIPALVSDETGSQLFDGDYGGYDWFENPGGVQSDEDYYARFDAENGYAYGWVAWYADVLNPTIVFDMGSVFTFQQIGVHGYQRLSGSMPIPSSMNISFSNDGVDFSSSLGLDVSGFVPEDSVIWKSASFDSTTSRFIKIEFPNTGGAAYWIDELSINGMDGAQFAASVPEPSSLIALGALLTPLIFRRRR